MNDKYLGICVCVIYGAFMLLLIGTALFIKAFYLAIFTVLVGILIMSQLVGILKNEKILNKKLGL